MKENTPKNTVSNQITQPALGRIRALAKAATPGPWVYCKDAEKLGVWHPDENRVYANLRGNANPVFGILASINPNTKLCDTTVAYIAAANPSFMLALVDEVERLRKDKARLEKEADWLAGTIRECQKFPDPCGPLWEEGDCILCWREAARKAVEESNEA